MDNSLTAMAEDLVALAARAKLTIITAESCTSGLLATVLSEAPGAGKILHGGFVTYTKEHKAVGLGVPDELLRSKGAVCDEVACAMAEGALARSHADLAAAITGVAGPEPDDDGNRVGRVFIAVARRGFADDLEGAPEQARQPAPAAVALGEIVGRATGEDHGPPTTPRLRSEKSAEPCPVTRTRSFTWVVPGGVAKAKAPVPPWQP